MDRRTVLRGVATAVASFRSGFYSLADLDNQMDLAVWGAPSSAGVQVSERGALALPPMWACVDLISKVGALLPGKIYSGDRYGERAPIKNHYLYPLVHDLANPQLPASEWRRLVLGHLLGWGNHFTWIEWKQSMRPKALWPLPPDRVKVKRSNVTAPIQYFVQSDGGQWVEFPAEDILHIRGLGYDGTVGYSPVGMLRDTFGLGLATQNSAATLHKNGITSRLLLNYPGTMNEQQTAMFKKTFQALNAGAENQHKMIVLQNGMTATPISINPHDAEFLAMWQYTDAKIYQIYGVPPHMVGAIDKQTSWGTGVEQMTLGFRTYTMQHWMDLIETWLQIKLLPDQSNVFIEYDFKALMRADTAARGIWYKTMIETGVYCPNDVLRSENETPYKGGDMYRRPLNTAFINANGDVVAFTPPGGGPAADPTQEPAEPPATEMPMPKIKTNGLPHLPN